MATQNLQMAPQSPQARAQYPAPPTPQAPLLKRGVGLSREPHGLGHDRAKFVDIAAADPGGLGDDGDGEGDRSADDFSETL